MVPREGGAQQVGKRSGNRLSLSVGDSKLTKLVNDLNFEISWTRVRLPPSPPSNSETDELTDEQLEIVCGGMRKEAFDVYATNLINKTLFYTQKEKQ